MKIKQIFTRGVSAILMVCAFSVLPISAANQGESYTVSSEWKYNFPDGAAHVNIEIGGIRVLQGEAAIIDSVTYVPLRTFAELCGAHSVSWNAYTKTATVQDGDTTVSIKDGGNYVLANGRYFYSHVPTRNIDDRLFVPIRIIAKALCVKVDWDADRRTVVLTDSGERLVSGDKFYNSNDLYWLSRIISAESAGEPIEGKIAVGNVVLNRKASPAYPNTVYGVIFDRKGGTQFTPAVSGTIYRTPTAESIIAAKICLEGYSMDDRILFFMNPRIATNNWISKNRPFAFRIANHDFYY